MTVTENTDARLVIRNWPWGFAVILWAAGAMCLWAALYDPALTGVSAWIVAVIGFGLAGLAWWYLPVTTTVFDRATGSVTHQEWRLVGSTVRAFRLSDIGGAQVDADWNDTSRVSRITLLTPEGRFALEKSFGTGARRPVETVINEWLTRP